MMDSDQSAKARSLAEIKELNQRYLLLVRQLYDVSPAEVAGRTGLPQSVCKQLAELTMEQIEQLASPDVIMIRDRLGAQYWERAIRDLKDERRAALRQAQAVLVGVEGERR